MLARNQQSSPFLSAHAVHVWDSSFRLREGGYLRDVSIEATWQRCARAVCANEAQGADRWSERVFEAQAAWQLLFDPRIISTAGSRAEEWPADAVVVLNAAAFVTAPFTDQVHFDHERFAVVAGLAVRCLDNVQSRTNAGAGGELRVGIIGLADALALLGKRYDSPAGRVGASRIAQSLAQGCLQANVSLAAERGAREAAIVPLQRDWGGAAVSIDFTADIARHGLRHRRLTAISSQRRLADFANRVSDALDPIEAPGTAARQPAAAGDSYPIALAHELHKPGAALRALLTRVSLASQIEMRGAVQPWIDAPIAYPFRVSDPDSVNDATFWQRLASAHRLGSLTLART